SSWTLSSRMNTSRGCKQGGRTWTPRRSLESTLGKCSTAEVSRRWKSKCIAAAVPTVERSFLPERVPADPRRGRCARPTGADREGRARMPMPMVNLISGGLHAGGNLDFQDFLLLPIGARSYSEALQMTVRVYRALSETLARHGFEGVLVGDEGGFGPRLNTNE